MTKKKKNTKLTIRQKNARKRYRNAKGHFVSYEEVQDIKNYWKRGIPADKKPEGYFDKTGNENTNFFRDQIKNYTPKEVKDFSNAGKKLYTESIPEMFLVDSYRDKFMIDSALPITVETTVDMRLNQAEAEGMDFFVGDEKVSKKEMLATMNEYSDQVKEDSIEQGKNWYKTYATLNVDYKNNKITFEQTPDEMDEIDGEVNTNKKSKRYNDSKTLNKEQKKWLKGRK